MRGKHCTIFTSFTGSKFVVVYLQKVKKPKVIKHINNIIIE